MDPLSLLVGALKVTPVEILRAAWKSSYETAQRLGMNQTQTARYMGTNRRTLQRAIDSDFQSTRADTLANALGRMQQNDLLSPTKINRNFVVFQTPLGTSEFVNQARRTAETFGNVNAVRLTITTDKEGYTGYKSLTATNYRQFDTTLANLAYDNASIEDIRDMTFRFGQ